MRCWFALLCVGVSVVIVGCGGGEPAQPASQAKPKKAAKAPAAPARPEPREPVDPNAFESVPDAIKAYVAAAGNDDQKTMALANEWMILQGPAAVLPLSKVLSDETAPAEQRIVAAKVLGRLPGTKAALLAAIDTKKPEVRVNVVQSLGMVKPVDAEIVAKCIELASDKDPQIQRYAVAALGKMESAAKDAVPLLQRILNDKEHNDTIRAEARKSLKAIDPRKGLMGLADEAGN
jgi:hypothetical protein